MKRIFFIVIFLFLSSCFLHAQEDLGKEIRLAHQYYREKEFDKAELLYSKIYTATQAKVYFNYYTSCLTEQGKFEEAEKIIKKQIRKHKKDLSYLINLGYVYKLHNEFSDCEKQYQSALNQVSTHANVRSLAHTFQQYGEYEYAEKVYLKGRKLNLKKYRQELAQLYAVQKKYTPMISEYLDILKEEPRRNRQVQNNMQYYMDKDAGGDFSEILRRSLLKRIQMKDAPTTYNHLLIWYYLQKKEFDGALLQAKALDRRFPGSEDKEIFELAETAKIHNDLNTSENAYNYIVEKGKTSHYYVRSRVGLLDIAFLKMTQKSTQDLQELENLEQQYIQTLHELGINKQTMQSVIKLSKLQTFYLNKPENAEKILTEVIEMKEVPPSITAECKIALGDVLVYSNDLDYAALIYAQVEKANRGNTRGDLAKFKKAKLAYFINDFRWAKAQFNALKVSTSKPIANDAIFYSVMIADNTEGDSLQTALKAYAQAELLVERRKYTEAENILDSLLVGFSFHAIADEAYFLKAEIFSRIKAYPEAIKYYQKVVSDFPEDILADAALLKLGILYEEHLQQENEASTHYKKLILEYPESIYVSEARRRFRKIRKKTS
ncbi:MAG: hypothetical protein CSB06_02075 [Bacteroidia bacterium]|nr:MAG: hypothetical protein CSB06_02075 [Bacteroidia bacterium]